MSRKNRKIRAEPFLLWSMLGALSAACGADVPLGSWLTETAEPEQSSTGGPNVETPADDVDPNVAADAGDETQNEATLLPTCNAPGSAGLVSQGAAAFESTVAYTDWSWPAPMDSVEFELRPETDGDGNGVFWSYQFSFIAGIVGLFGLQDQGLFQADPPGGPIEVAKMALFWISGPPMAAELGDIPYPDARTAPEFSKGVPWTSIHVRYDWEVCRAYRLRLALESTGPAGNRWYGAWIRDQESGEETFLGRMLAPEPWGQLSAFSSMWTNSFVESGEIACEDIEYASALFGTPRANDGRDEPRMRNSRFENPAKCPSSRITEFDGAVRHEIGVGN